MSSEKGEKCRQKKGRNVARKRHLEGGEINVDV